jgi:hypothetical protein
MTRPLPEFTTVPEPDSPYRQDALDESRDDLNRLVAHLRRHAESVGLEQAQIDLAQGLLDSRDWRRATVSCTVLAAAVARLAAAL